MRHRRRSPGDGLAAARDRLARTICADREMFSETNAQRGRRDSPSPGRPDREGSRQRVVARRPAGPLTVVLAGEGDFLARRVVAELRLAGKVISLTDRLGPDVSRCGPVHALAVLAREADLQLRAAESP